MGVGDSHCCGKCQTVNERCIEQVVGSNRTHTCFHGCTEVHVARSMVRYGNTSVLEDQELVRAAREGDQNALVEAIQHGADLETRSSFMKDLDAPTTWAGSLPEIRLGLTPLMHAAQEGHIDCLRLLLMARASVFSEDEDGMSPLHFAASAACLDAAAALVWAGAYPAAIDRTGATVLDHLPPEIHHDVIEFKRWRATLDVTGTGQPSPKGDSLEKLACKSCSLDRSASVNEAVVETTDPLDYTRNVLEGMSDIHQAQLRRQLWC